MQPQPAPPRRFRLQVSLRMLLVFMAVIGAGLAVFRWPWVETTTTEVVADPFGDGPNNNLRLERRTTYRRNWRAEPVKNGLDQTWIGDRLWHEAHYYDGALSGRRRVFDEATRVIAEAHYRGGWLNGPFRAGDGEKWIWEGNYRADLTHGTWRELASRQQRHRTEPPSFVHLLRGDGTVDPALRNGFQLPKDPIRIESNWRDGKRQGPTTWKTIDGEVLNVAEYDQNLFVGWNGEPVVEQFRQWLSTEEVDDPSIPVALLGTYDRVFVRPPDRDLDPAGALGHDMRIKFEPWDRAAPNMVIHLDRPVRVSCNWLLEVLWKNAAAPVVCEFAAVEGYEFRYRYGALWLVSRADPEPTFVDPTGVDQIQFPPGSQAAADWEEIIDVREDSALVEGSLRQLLDETAVKYVTEEVDSPEIFQSKQSLAGRDIVFRRSRRNAVGYVLYRTGCRCELSGGELVIRPRENRTELQRRCNPLEVNLDPFR